MKREEPGTIRKSNGRQRMPTITQSLSAQEIQCFFSLVFMQVVHMYTRFSMPFSTTRTRWTFTFHRRLVCRIEWLTLLPNCGPLPHTSHLAIA